MSVLFFSLASSLFFVLLCSSSCFLAFHTCSTTHWFLEVLEARPDEHAAAYNLTKNIVFYNKNGPRGPKTYEHHWFCNACLGAPLGALFACLGTLACTRGVARKTAHARMCVHTGGTCARMLLVLSSTVVKYHDVT